MKIDPVAEAFAQLGYPVSLARGIGILELVCVVIYVIPRTSVLDRLSWRRHCYPRAQRNECTQPVIAQKTG